MKTAMSGVYAAAPSSLTGTGHRVTVSGPNTHESTAERTLGNKEFGDLRVASLKTVSGTCDK